jgi:hypothetical protein
MYTRQIALWFTTVTGEVQGVHGKLESCMYVCILYVSMYGPLGEVVSRVSFGW